MSSLQLKYTELCSVLIEQPFYENNYCKSFSVVPSLDFDIVPSAECVLTMQKLNIIYRRTLYNNGFLLLARVTGKNLSDNDLLRFPPAKTDKLTFNLILTNPDLLAFDDLPVQINKNEVFYFSNSNNDVTAVRDRLHLTDIDSGVQWPNDSIVIAGNFYRYQHAA